MTNPRAVLLKTLICSKLRLAGKLAEARELRIIANGKDDKTIAGLKSLIGDYIGMCITLALRIIARRQIVHRLVGERRHLHIEQGHVDVLSLP